MFIHVIPTFFVNDEFIPMAVHRNPCVYDAAKKSGVQANAATLLNRFRANVVGCVCNME